MFYSNIHELENSVSEKFLGNGEGIIKIDMPVT